MGREVNARLVQRLCGDGGRGGALQCESLNWGVGEIECRHLAVPVKTRVSRGLWASASGEWVREHLFSPSLGVVIIN